MSRLRPLMSPMLVAVAVVATACTNSDVQSPSAAAEGGAAPVAASEAADTSSEVERTYVELGDGTSMAVSIQLPEGSGPFPILFSIGPYSSVEMEDPADWVSTNADDLFLERGFGIVVADERGSGCSAGVYRAFDAAQTGADGAELIDWIAVQPWSDGNVGMMSASALGSSQLFVAAQAPEALKAIAPFTPFGDAYEDITWVGGVFQAIQPTYWTTMHQPERSERAAERASEDDTCAANRESHALNRTRNFAFEAPRFGTNGPGYAERSPAVAAASVDVPALVAGAVQDRWYPSGGSGAVRVFEALRGPKRLVLTNGGHHVPPSHPDLHEVQADWFDYWLKGEDNGVPDEPPVVLLLDTYETDDETMSTNTVIELDSWPPPAAGPEFNLTADGRLDAAPGVPSTVRMVTAPPSSQEPPPALGEFLGQFETAWSEGWEGGLTFVGPTVEEDLLLAGHGRVRLRAALDVPDMDFFVVVSEVTASGEVRYVQRGILRASKADAQPPVGNEAVRHTFANSTPVPLGQAQSYEIAIFPMAHVVRAGSRLRLDIVPPDVAANEFGWGAVVAPWGGTAEISTGEGGSALVLPIVDLAVRPGEPAPCGGVPEAPCRQP